MSAMNHDRIWYTPHASGYTVGLGARVADAVIAAVTAWSRGEPVPWRVV
jgi:phosphoglycerate dehydrogenase-like enzyme